MNEKLEGLIYKLDMKKGGVDVDPTKCK